MFNISIKRTFQRSPVKFFGFSLLFLYEFGFSSFINIRPFNYAFNAFLVLLFLTCVYKFLAYKKRKDLLFFCLFGLMSFFFIFSDVVNRMFSFQPFVLLAMLFSGFVLPDSVDDISMILMIKTIANTLGLTFVVVLNFNVMMTAHSVISSPFLNLDTFASLARSGVFLSFLSFLSLNGKTKYRFYCFVPFFINLIYLLASLRVGSILLAILCALLFLYIYLFKKRKTTFLIVLTAAIGVFSLLLLFLPSRLEVINRIKMLFLQIFDLNHIYEGSLRERSCMIIRDFCMCFRYPIFGMGSNGTLKMNTVVGHNLFGCISLSYGLVASAIYLIYVLSPIRLAKTIKNGYLLYFALYILAIEIFDIFYGMGSLSRTNYFLVGLSFFSTRLPDLSFGRARMASNFYYEVKL